MALMDCRVSGLHFPLMVLVDYRGTLPRLELLGWVRICLLINNADD
jgi:hypothetical protein